MSSQQSTSYRFCSVPQCTSSAQLYQPHSRLSRSVATTVQIHRIKHRKNIFFLCQEMKKFERFGVNNVMKRDPKKYKPLTLKSNRHCCEDRLEIKKDTNLMKYRLVGGRLMLKKNVVPHIFECQITNSNKPERSFVAKRRKAEALRNRAEIIEQLLSADAKATVVQQPTEFIECVQSDEDSKDHKDLDPISVPMDCLDVDIEANVKIEKKYKNRNIHKVTNVSQPDKNILETERTEELVEVKLETEDNSPLQSDTDIDTEHHRTSNTTHEETQTRALCTKTHIREEWEVLGKSIGLQLRDLDSGQLVILQKLISDGIYYAKTGLLTQGSRINLGLDTCAISSSQKSESVKLPRPSQANGKAPRRCTKKDNTCLQRNFSA